MANKRNTLFLPDYGYGGRDLNYTTESICDRMNEEVDKFVSAKDAEIAELRKCLKDAVTNFCTNRPHEYDDGFGNCESFQNGSCVCEECWRNELVNKWRKVLEGATNA